MVSKYCHRCVAQNVLPPPLSSMEGGPVIKSFEIFALKKKMLSLDYHARCQASRYLLTAQHAVCVQRSCDGSGGKEVSQTVWMF